MKTIITVCTAAMLLVFSSCKKDLVALEKTTTITIRDTTSLQWLSLRITPADSLWDLKKIAAVSIAPYAPLQNAPNQLLPGDRKRKTMTFVPLPNRLGSLYGVEYHIQEVVDYLKIAPGGPYIPASSADLIGAFNEHASSILMLAHGFACITTLKGRTANNTEIGIGVIYAVNQAGPTKQIVVNAGLIDAPILPGNEIAAIKE
jgi:hypothetical protein